MQLTHEVFQSFISIILSFYKIIKHNPKPKQNMINEINKNRKENHIDHLFSFNGRIGRMKYALMLYSYLPLFIVITVISDIFNLLFLLLLIPLLWIACAQGTQRCHDMGHNGWWQFIPFYFFWMIFQVGDDSNNQYGKKPENQPLDKENKTRSQIIKNVIIILIAAFISLLIPICITGYVNRLVADLTGQWYLSSDLRILITFLITIFTYGIAYLLIHFSYFRKSVIFNVVSIFLTFLWSALIGLLFMPD